MVKIEYDLNNAEECEMVDDYFFIKYFFESLSFDWRREVCKLVHEFNKKELNCEKIFEDLNKIILDHTNKCELDFVLEILYKYDIIKGESNEKDLIALICYHKLIISEYKRVLINRFSKTTYITFKFN